MNRFMFGADLIIDAKLRGAERIVCRAEGDTLYYMLVKVDKTTGGYMILHEFRTKESVEFRLGSQR